MTIQPPVALKIANDLKDLGTAAFKSTDYFTAQIKCSLSLHDFPTTADDTQQTSRLCDTSISIPYLLLEI